MKPRQPADTRPDIDLSPDFCKLMAQLLMTHPDAMRMLLGVYEGRGLKGDYEIRILAARLVPKAPS